MKKRRSFRRTGFYRQVPVRRHGSFSVGRHIVRIDMNEPGKAGTHGWQVHYGDRTKLFSDYTENRSGPSAALKDAENYLQRIYRGYAPRHHLKVLARKTNQLPVGVSDYKVIRAGRNVMVHTFQATIPQFNKKCACLRVYIGTENTITPERKARALKKIIALRKKAITTYLHACKNHKIPIRK